MGIFSTSPYRSSQNDLTLGTIPFLKLSQAFLTSLGFPFLLSDHTFSGAITSTSFGGCSFNVDVLQPKAGHSVYTYLDKLIHSHAFNYLLHIYTLTPKSFNSILSGLFSSTFLLDVSKAPVLTSLKLTSFSFRVKFPPSIFCLIPSTCYSSYQMIPSNLGDSIPSKKPRSHTIIQIFLSPLLPTSSELLRLLS